MTKLSDGSFSIGSDVWPGVSKLIEECGELQQVLGKLIATRGHPDHWEGSNLRERLVEELADVQAATIFVIEMNLTNQERIVLHERSVNKIDLFHMWQRGQA